MAIKKNIAAAEYFYQNNDFENAKLVCKAILKDDNKNVNAIILLADINIKSEKYDKALTYINEAINEDDGNYKIYFKKSLILYKLTKFKEALENNEKSIKLNSKNEEAYNLKAIILENLNEDKKALESWNKAIEIKPDYAEAYFNMANYYNFNNNYELSLHCYNKAIKINNKYFLALVNRADLYYKNQKFEFALLDYNNLINQNPEIARLYYSKASVLNYLGQYKGAISSLNEVINLKPKFAKAFFLRGMIVWKQKLYKQALLDLEKSYSLEKNNYFLNSLIILKSILCDWKNIENYQEKLINSIENIKITEFPIFTQHFIDSPELEQKVSIAFNKNFKISEKPKLNKKNKKIRLGYYSADFRNHATSNLIARIFELHNKEKFEIIAFSFCPLNNKDLTQKRIIKSCDKFIDVHKKIDQEISQLSRELEIDIALDLMGFANNNKYNIFALGCAPIQINYLGYPGTCGPYVMDYIVADNTLISKENEKFFSEKIIYLPNSYQPNDDKKEISKKEISKKDFNLPEDKFIYCSFNRSYKITPKMLNIWVDILKQNENSILWLLADNDLTKSNLKNEITKLGIDVERLIFADQIDHSVHLARHKLADLFIDTFPIPGHTTVSDALWTGVPIVTKIGNSFASRVSASLLKALNVCELITKTDEEYKEKILSLSNDKNKLLKIKEKIIKNISIEPLFNSKLYTNNLEKAYINVYKNHLENNKNNYKV